nr:hypothetical protein [Solidesulfovibrio alcoholivorans]
MKHDSDGTAFTRHARSLQCGEEDVLLLAVVAFVDKNFEEIEDASKLGDWNGSTRFDARGECPHDAQHAKNAFMFRS